MSEIQIKQKSKSNPRGRARLYDPEYQRQVQVTSTQSTNKKRQFIHAMIKREHWAKSLERLAAMLKMKIPELTDQEWNFINEKRHRMLLEDYGVFLDAILKGIRQCKPHAMMLYAKIAGLTDQKPIGFQDFQKVIHTNKLPELKPWFKTTETDEKDAVEVKEIPNGESNAESRGL